ncbi:hypothetical protein [Deferrisoma palaeochoriense]
MGRPEAEETRLRYLYRALVVRGKLRLPPEAARALVGPDCAYHLYRHLPARGEAPTPLPAPRDGESGSEDGGGPA